MSQELFIHSRSVQLYLFVTAWHLENVPLLGNYDLASSVLQVSPIGVQHFVQHVQLI